MKQVLHSLRTGKTEVANIPVPNIKKGQLLIHTKKTLLSVGTEKMILEFGKAGWIEKAYQQPEKVRMVINKIKTDGFQPTIDAVFNKLDQPMPLGYCNVGKILKVGYGETDFKVDDRVVSNGSHANVVRVPFNLCAKIPKNVPDECATFTVLGAIALQGIRLAQPTLGETIVVSGLGLIGLITVQLLRANGCNVLGLDFNKERLQLASNFGAEVVDMSLSQDPVKIAKKYSRNRGVDAVIITATSKSNNLMHQAALMCRKRGRIVLVGVTGLELSRDDFYKKELSFQVSSSYGPGRYDPNYENKGQDYPIGFVRWTAKRNFEAVLDMMASGRLNVNPMITHRFDISNGEKAYELINGTKPSLGILLNYSSKKISDDWHTVKVIKNDIVSDTLKKKVSVSFVGSGNYATAILIPAFKSCDVKFNSIVSDTGVSGLHAARKFGFNQTTTKIENVLNDLDTDALIIATPHNTHSDMVIKGLAAGKHIFVEKPLCLSLDDLEKIKMTYNQAKQTKSQPPLIMLGFNRRFSPHIKKIKELLKGVKGPKSLIMTINAGNISKDHWTQNLEVGGGRVIGEACHFIDLLRFICGEKIISYHRSTMNSELHDTTSLQLNFEDGSIGSIHYFANGSKSFPKERLEVFASGGILQLDNYRKLTGYGWSNFKKMGLLRQDKGHKNCANAFVKAISEKKQSPIPIEEILEVSRISIELANI